MYPLFISVSPIQWTDQPTACSTSAKKLIGLRFKTKRPTGIIGNSLWGQTLVKSNGLTGNCSACSMVITCSKESKEIRSYGFTFFLKLYFLSTI